MRHLYQRHDLQSVPRSFVRVGYADVTITRKIVGHDIDLARLRMADSLIVERQISKFLKGMH